MSEGGSAAAVNQFGDNDDECSVANCNKKHSMSIVVTNLNDDFFTDTDRKSAFCAHDVLATFQYLPSFRRVRVNFRTASGACCARSAVHDTLVAGCRVNCYFIQTRSCSTDSDGTADGHLQPPTPRRQFIISPPASPPEEWRQAMEARPAPMIAAADLTVALDSLNTPGEYELFSSEANSRQPAIVLHVSADAAAADAARREADQSQSSVSSQ